jgi:hypothetical protein
MGEKAVAAQTERHHEPGRRLRDGVNLHLKHILEPPGIGAFVEEEGSICKLRSYIDANPPSWIAPHDRAQGSSRALIVAHKVEPHSIPLKQFAVRIEAPPLWSQYNILYMCLLVLVVSTRPIFEGETKRGPNRLKRLGRAGKMRLV